MPRLERTAIGVWAIARGLEDHAQLTGGEHRPMEAMGALLPALGDLVRVFAAEVLGDHPEGGMPAALHEVARGEPPVPWRRIASRWRTEATTPERRARSGSSG